MNPKADAQQASPEGLIAGESDQIRLRKKAAEIFTRV
jgi:hypothetical protein